MRRWSCLAIALAGCLGSPPAGTGSAGDAAPRPHVEVLGVFARDTFGQAPGDDLVMAVTFDGQAYALHLPSVDGGLAAALDAVEVIPLPFTPVAMTGADIDRDDTIDLVAVGAAGELAVLANTAGGLAPIEQQLVVDSGSELHDITSIVAPDLAGDERLFVAGPDGIWKSEVLDGTGEIHLRELGPAMPNVAPPAAYFATHDDVASWYVGLAHGTAIDLWANSSFDLVTENDLITYQAPSAPVFGTWRRLPDPLRVNFFGVTADSELIWVSQEFSGAAQQSRVLADIAGGTLRDLTTTQQPDGYDLITVSAESDGMVGVQAITGITTPTAELGTRVSLTIPSAIDTRLPLWVRPAAISATPFAGQEILVFDRSGHLLCVGFDADHTSLSACGEQDLEEVVAGRTRPGRLTGSSTSDRPDW